MTASKGPSARDIDVKDRLDIFDLYARASHASDASDGDGWAATFTEDGEIVSPTYGATARGRGALKEFIETTNDAALARGDQYRHVVTAITMVPAGPARIDAKAFLMITATRREGSRIDRTIVMIDELRLVDGEWLFSRREARPD